MAIYQQMKQQSISDLLGPCYCLGKARCHFFLSYSNKSILLSNSKRISQFNLKLTNYIKFLLGTLDIPTCLLFSPLS